MGVARIFSGLGRVAAGPWIDRPACDAAFGWMHAVDPRGDRLHLAAACLGMFLLAGPVTVTELAFAPLLVVFLLRWKSAGPVWIHGFGQPAVLVALGLMAWTGLSLAWSADRAQGLDELARLRWFLLPGLVFPAIAGRGPMVRALAAGLFVAGLAQLASGLGPLAPLFETRRPGRISGWWDPVVAGSVQCGAAGLFLAPALRGSGRGRWCATAGLAVAVAGVVASGTRGAWIACALLLLAGGIAAVRGASARTRRAAIGAGLAGCLLAAGVAVAQREGLAVRLTQARAELEAAAAGDLNTPTGGRLAVMGLAVEAGLRRPWGLGAGGLQPAATERFGPAHAASGLAHAHSSPLHLFGTLGLPGLALGGLLAWVMLRNALDAGALPGSLESGLPYAAAGVLLAGAFDAVHLNTQTCALLGALAALSPAYRPVTG